MSTPDKTPRPVRYRWLKRICVGGVVLLVALLLLRLWWGNVADRRLQAEIDRIVAAGEPLFPDDFNSPPLVDEKNAAAVLKKAAAPWENSRTPTLELPAGPQPGPRYLTPPGQAYWTEAEAAVKTHANALTLIRKARSMPDADWGLRMASPTQTIWLPFQHSQRRLVRFVCGVARYRQHTGKHDEAVESLRDVIAMSAALDAHPTLIGHMVAEAVRRLAKATIESILPTLSIESAVARLPQVSQPATRAHIRALIAELLNTEPRQASLIRALQSERMIQLDTVTLLANGEGPAMMQAMGVATPPAVTMSRSVVWPIKPLFLLDGAHMIQVSTRLVDAARQPSWPEASGLLPAEPMDGRGLRAMARFLSGMIASNLKRVIELHFENLAKDRMTAVALALRMYELDHGQRPQSLDALVPAYLSRVPDDPFATNGRPIRYAPDADPPVLYSVGYDGKDDRGTFSFANGRINNSEKDIPFFLNGKQPLPPGANPTPATSPSPQTGDDDSDKADDERDAQQRADGQPEP